MEFQPAFGRELIGESPGETVEFAEEMAARDALRLDSRHRALKSNILGIEKFKIGATTPFLAGIFTVPVKMLHHCHGQSSPPHPADAVDPNSPLLHTSALQKLRVLTLFLSDYLYCSLQTAQCIFEDALFCWAWTGRCEGHHSSWTGDCSTV